MIASSPGAAGDTVSPWKCTLTSSRRPANARMRLRTVISIASPGATRIVGVSPRRVPHSKAGYPVTGSITTSSVTRATPRTARTAGISGKTSATAVPG
jgi:hypothetical protein